MQSGTYGQLGHSDLIRLLKERDQEIWQLQLRLAGVPQDVEATKSEESKPAAVKEHLVLNVSKFKSWFYSLFTPLP